jgi:hypothetical protein
MFTSHVTVQILHTVKKCCGDIHHLDICRQRYVLQLLRPYLIRVYVIQDVGICHIGFLGCSRFVRVRALTTVTTALSTYCIYRLEWLNSPARYILGILLGIDPTRQAEGLVVGARFG